jgi:succinate dehydrogenase / fumarate reductase iron-sulfur subunit
VSSRTLNLTLQVWRQKGPKNAGQLVTYQAKGISSDASFLEMLDRVNEDLIQKGEEPIAFDSDCREGICGMCSMMVDGCAHGPQKGTTVCQLHMRHFQDGQTIVIEPWRAAAFPVVKDLVVDRSALDRIITAGGFVSVNSGAAPEANAVLVPKPDAEKAMDAAACIGCGACVAACKNASAMLFTSAKVSQMALMPQGHPERARRVIDMVTVMDAAGFGNCTNESECEAACPKEISVDNIARMNREYVLAMLTADPERNTDSGA